MLAPGDDIAPVPGTRAVTVQDENLAAVRVRLTADERGEIDAILPSGAQGDRYVQALRTVNRTTK